MQQGATSREQPPGSGRERQGAAGSGRERQLAAGLLLHRRVPCRAARTADQGGSKVDWALDVPGLQLHSVDAPSQPAPMECSKH